MNEAVARAERVAASFNKAVEINSRGRRPKFGMDAVFGRLPPRVSQLRRSARMKSFVVAVLGLGLTASCAVAASHYSGFEEKVVTLRLVSAATGERLADADVQYVQRHAQPSMLDAFSGPPVDSAEIQRELKSDGEGKVTITLSYFVSSHWERDEPDSPHEDFYYPVGWIRVRVHDAWEWCRFPRKYKDEKVRIEVVSGEAPPPPEKSSL